MSEKQQSTSPSTTPVKNRLKAISTEEKLGIIADLKRMSKMLAHTVMSDSFKAAYHISW